MTLQRFIQLHRPDIDKVIRARVKVERNRAKERLNDYQRRLWVLNDEGLYNMAKAHGVKL